MSLKRLWELQELDLKIGALAEKRENIPLHLEVKNAAAHLIRVEEELERAEQSHREQCKKIRRGELDLEAITADYIELHQKLYSGTVKNVKELEQMEIKLRSVKQNQLALEEKLLGLMELAEDQAELLQNLTGQKEKAAAESQRLQQLLDKELLSLGNELDKLQEQRDLLAAQIEPERLELYRELTRRHQGRGLARVIDDICQGCSVFISSAQRGFLYDPRALIYCENCGCLLVRFTERETGTE